MNDNTDSNVTTTPSDVINVRIDKKSAVRIGLVAFFVFTLLMAAYLTSLLNVLSPRMGPGRVAMVEAATLLGAIILFAAGIGGVLALVFDSNMAAKEGFIGGKGSAFDRVAAERTGVMAGAIFAFAIAACFQGVVHPSWTAVLAPVFRITEVAALVLTVGLAFTFLRKPAARGGCGGRCAGSSCGR